MSDQPLQLELATDNIGSHGCMKHPAAFASALKLGMLFATLDRFNVHQQPQRLIRIQ